jgi:DNA-binding NarL/FixJ family response regulator
LSNAKQNIMYILLVEEDHFYATMISGFLKKEGFGQIKHIDNGIDCLLQVYEEATPDLVILDAHLGRVNGVEVIEKLMRHKPGLKVIILASQASGKRISPAVQDVVLEVIQKDDRVFEKLMPQVRFVHSEVISRKKAKPVTSLLLNLKRFIFAP